MFLGKSHNISHLLCDTIVKGMWAICVLVWCLFLTFICSALFLDQKIIAEVEMDLPIERRPSRTSLNGRGVAFAAYRKHAAMFPNSRLRLLSYGLWAAAVLSLVATLSPTSWVFGF
jgi:hypothetical protein